MGMQRFFILLFLIFTKSIFAAEAVVVVPVKKVSQTIALSSFNHISVTGLLNVQLHSGSTPKVILKGQSEDLAKVLVKVEAGQLRVLFPGHPRPCGIDVVIYAPDICVLRYKGKGSIRGRHLRLKNLKMIIDNQGPTSIQGRIGLRKLVVQNTGFVRVDGINSSYLNLLLVKNAHVALTGSLYLSSLNLSGNGTLFVHGLRSKNILVRARDRAVIALAGRVTRLDVELWGKATFRGRYLYALDTFVKTHNLARAEINTLERQHVLALDASDIYFYHIPMINASFMGDDGSVLDMRDWRSYIHDDYNLYNKQGVHY
jgi:hypothetical protein